MKGLKIKGISYLAALIGLLGLVGCEDVINLDTETGPSFLVVDGWITNQPGPQSIRLSLATGYFSNKSAPPALGAEVTLADTEGNTYLFKDSLRNGYYTWIPQTTTPLGQVGRTYTLQVRYEGEEYRATSQIKRVPVIDSLVYREERLPINPSEGPREGFLGEFYARDFPGVGDTYWIKPLRGGRVNGTNPASISLAFDGAFSPGAPSDGLIFIQPLRRSITLNGLFSAGDTIGVELHSITPETYYFLFQVRQESGNGGIFAVPPANIPTNIRNVSPGGKKALGYFGASAVSRAETVIDPAQARPKE